MSDIGSRGNYVDDLRAAIQDKGITAVAREAEMAPSTIRRFLSDPMNCRVSTLARLSVATAMPYGELHPINRETGACVVCDEPPEVHYPLFPDHQEADSAKH